MPQLQLLLLETDTYLDLDPKTSVNLNAINPIFDRDTIDRTWTYPFKLPVSPHNQLALGFPDRFDHVPDKAKRPCRMIIGGLPGPTGVLVVKKASNGRIEATFQNQTLDAVQILERTSLKALDGSLQVAEPFCGSIILQSQNPFNADTEIAIRINDILFRYNYYEFEDMLAAIEAQFPGLMELNDNNPAQGYSFRINCVPDLSSYAFDLVPILDPDPIAQTYFFTISNEFELEILRIRNEYLQFDAFDESVFFRMPTVYAPKFFDGEVEGFSQLLNQYDHVEGQYISDTETAENDLALQSIVFIPRVFFILQQVGAFLNYRIKGTYVDDEEMAELLLWSNNIGFDTSLNHIPSINEFPPPQIGTGQFDFTFPKTAVQLAEMLSDQYVLDIIKALNNTFCHYLAVSEGKLEFVPVRNILRSIPIDWTNRTEQGYNAVYDPKESFTLDYDRQDEELTERRQLLKVDGGLNAEEYILPMFSFHEQVKTFDRTYRLPVTSQVGTVPPLNLENDPGFRLLFWRGLQPDTEGNPYPYASHSRVNALGEQVGNYSLDWNGPGGLFETWWAEYILLLQHGRTLTIEMRLSVQDILQVLEWQSVRRQIVTPNGTAVGVIKELRVKLSPSSIGLARVTFQLEP
ncbi:MAG: hypothetical protein AAFY91_04400 [Bacteroidota bacterium]